MMKTLELTSFQKDSELAKLMTLIEKRHHVPLFRNPSWEQHVVSLYRKIS